MTVRPSVLPLLVVVAIPVAFSVVVLVVLVELSFWPALVQRLESWLVLVLLVVVVVEA